MVIDSGLLGLPLPGYALAALAYSALAVRAWRDFRDGSAKDSVPALLLAAAVASAAWSLTEIVANRSEALAPHIAGRLIDVCRYGFWFAILLSLLHSDQWRSVRTAGFGYVVVVGLVLLATGAIMPFVELTPVMSDTFSRMDQLTSMMFPVYGLVLLEQVFRRSSEDAKWGIKPICLGLCCVFGFDFYIYSEAALFARIDVDALSIRGAVHALAVPFLFIASRRNSNWMWGLRVSRAAVFHSVALFLAGLYLLFISAVGYYVKYFGGTWGRALQLGTLTIAFVTLVAIALSGSMRAKLRVVLGKHFFSYRYDYRREWLRFTATLSSGRSPQETGALVIRGLADMLESTGGGLWSRSPANLDFIQTACWNVPRQQEREPCDSTFSVSLLQTGWIVDLDDYRSEAAKQEGFTVPDWLVTNPQLWLVIPLIVADELIGFVVLARARTAIELNWEVTDLLKTASRQAASFLAQMQATEALLEVRKFDAFNRMSAFVVHDLKNIVTQLSLMMKNEQRLRDNPEFHADMLLTIESSLDKMRQLMLQLREGEAPAGGVSGVPLFQVLQRISALARSRGRMIEIHVVDRVVTRGHDERIQRVLSHVVQNALDATSPSGTVTVKLGRSGGRASIEVCDNGGGMSPEFVQTRLFRPFQTTKATGMGIGAYESSQYIQELGGSIAVDSQIGRGTSVTILLPLFDSRQTSDLQMQREP